MQRWICQFCRKIYEIDKNKTLSKAMKHALEHALLVQKQIEERGPIERDNRKKIKN